LFFKVGRDYEDGGWSNLEVEQPLIHEPLVHEQTHSALVLLLLLDERGVNHIDLLISKAQDSRVVLLHHQLFW